MMLITAVGVYKYCGIIQQFDNQTSFGSNILLFGDIEEFIKNNDIDKIKKIPDLHLIDKKYNTLLHSSAKYNKPEISMYLLHKNLNPNQKNSHGKTPFTIVCSKGNPNHVALLWDPHPSAAGESVQKPAPNHIDSPVPLSRTGRGAIPVRLPLNWFSAYPSELWLRQTNDCRPPWRITFHQKLLLLEKAAHLLPCQKYFLLSKAILLAVRCSSLKENRKKVLCWLSYGPIRPSAGFSGHPAAP